MRKFYQSPTFKKQKRLKRLKLVFFIFCFAVIGSGLFFSTRFLFHAIAPKVKQSKIFQLQNVVCASTEHVLEADLKKYVKPFIGTNIFEIDLNRLKTEIKKHPWVLDVNVTRIFPDRLRLHIVEREPKAILSMEKLYFLDAQGKIIAEIRPTDNVNFPVISGITPRVYQKGETILQAYELFQKYHENAYLKDWPISEIHWKPKSGFTIFTSNPSFEIQMGKDQFFKKMTRLEKVLKDLSQKSMLPKRIDLNFTKKAVVKLSK